MMMSQGPRRYAELLLSAYLQFAGTTWPFQARGIQNRDLVGKCVSLTYVGMKHDWTNGTMESIIVFVYCDPCSNSVYPVHYKISSHRLDRRYEKWSQLEWDLEQV
jgi:hypothetical protein